MKPLKLGTPQYKLFLKQILDNCANKALLTALVAKQSEVEELQKKLNKRGAA